MGYRSITEKSSQSLYKPVIESDVHNILAALQGQLTLHTTYAAANCDNHKIKNFGCTFVESSRQD